MFLKEEEKNIVTGILGTVVVHLVVLIIFLVARLDKVRDKHQETIVIEFDEEVYQDIEKMMKQSKAEDSEVAPLTEEVKKNIAVNTANKLNEQISTEKYIEQLKQELNIDDLNPKREDMGDEPQLQAEEPDVKAEPKKKKTFYKGPTRINFDLDNRTDRYIHIPVYKCQGHGTVIVNITVNQQGEVVGTSIKSSTTNEACIMQAAIESAKISLFNRDQNADPKQRGTISYEFIAQ